MYDSIIIGGGPAGLTASIYLRRAGLKVLILEKETIGGQIASSPLVQNYPGFTSISGMELANNLYEQVDNLGVEVELEEVLKVENQEENYKVITDYNEYLTKTVIVATGSKYRLLGINNEKELIGKGISFCTSCDGAFYKDKDVAVIGGANTAVTNAIYLSDICHKVYLIYRNQKLKSEQTLIDTLEKKKNVEIIYNSVVTKIVGDTELEKIIINDNKEINVDGMFISVGMDAQSDIVKELLELDNNNYIITSDCATNKKGIFVAGDCRQKSLRQLATAVNDGAISATLAINYLKTLK